MVFKNKKLDKDIEEFISLTRCLLLPAKANEQVFNSEVGNGQYNLGDYESLLRLWNNTVTTYPLEMSNLHKILISERFNAAVFVIKEENFIYGYAIPCGILSLSGGRIFAIPDTTQNIGLAKIFKMLQKIAKDIIQKNTSTSESVKEYIIDAMGTILTAVVVYKIAVERKLMASNAAFVSKNIVRLAKQVSQLDNFDTITLKIFAEYDNRSIMESIQSLFYENALMVYLNEITETVTEDHEITANSSDKVVEEDKSKPSSLESVQTEQGKIILPPPPIPTMEESDTTNTSPNVINFDLSDPNVPNLRMFA